MCQLRSASKLFNQDEKSSTPPPQAGKGGVDSHLGTVEVSPEFLKKLVDNVNTQVMEIAKLRRSRNTALVFLGWNKTLKNCKKKILNTQSPPNNSEEYPRRFFSDLTESCL